MITREVWYREALDVELQRQFKTLPEGEEGMLDLLRIFLRTGKLPDEAQAKDLLGYLYKRLGYSFRDPDASPPLGGIRDDEYAGFWKLLWTYPELMPGDTDTLRRYAWILSDSPPGTLPSVPLTSRKYTRELDFSHLGPPVEPHPWSTDPEEPENLANSARSDQVIEVLHNTPWEQVDEVTHNYPISVAVMDWSGWADTEYVYWKNTPTDYQIWEQLDAMFERPDVAHNPQWLTFHQQRIEMDTSHLPGNWPQAIMIWKRY